MGQSSPSRSCPTVANGCGAGGGQGRAHGGGSLYGRDDAGRWQRLGRARARRAVMVHQRAPLSGSGVRRLWRRNVADMRPRCGAARCSSRASTSDRRQHVGADGPGRAGVREGVVGRIESHGRRAREDGFVRCTRVKHRGPLSTLTIAGEDVPNTVVTRIGSGSPCAVPTAPRKSREVAESWHRPRPLRAGAQRARHATGCGGRRRAVRGHRSASGREHVALRSPVVPAPRRQLGVLNVKVDAAARTDRDRVPMRCAQPNAST